MNRRELLAGATTLAPCVLGVNVFPIQPYDPVAVLEAMRERGFAPTFFTAPMKNGWNASIAIHRDKCIDGIGVIKASFQSDFPSAVRWLHAQAAAADPTFAEQFPVPE